MGIYQRTLFIIPKKKPATLITTRVSCPQISRVIYRLNIKYTDLLSSYETNTGL